QARIVAQSLATGERKILVQAGSDALYTPTGHIVYALRNVLFAVPFDANELRVTGGPVPIVEGIQRAANATTATANYGVSGRGTLVYLTGLERAAAQSVVALVDRNGLVRRLNVPPAQYRNPRVSPDGRQIAVETLGENDQSIIWVYDLAGKTAIRRLTQEGSNTRPIWTPDSKRITFGSVQGNPPGIFWQLADGSGLPERLTTSEGEDAHLPESWSPDARVLSFAAVKGGVGGGVAVWSLWTLSMDSKDKPALFYDIAASNQFGSVFSRDGAWVAYASNEGPDQQFGIYVQPFPPTGVKYQISQSGGAWPVWSPNGDELFYRLNFATNTIPTINAVTITTKPVPAFSSERNLPIKGFMGFVNFRDYDIMPNAREFVMLFPAAASAPEETPRPKIQVVLNWHEELKARVRTAH
ncbi:MAG: PD40 domain-containing protein, partial [Acidobacteria bacterium]|nr:PD40 domain-containing protein [Acidobacteriota bacterium]